MKINFDAAANTLLSLLVEAPALLQVTAFFFTWIGCWLPIAILCATILNWQASLSSAVDRKLPLLGSLYLIAPFVLWIFNWVLGESFSNYGWSWKPQIFGFATVGLSVGVLSLVVLFGIETLLDWVTWQRKALSNITSVLLPTLVLALLVGGIEELIFRGFLITQLQQDYSVTLAAIISSLIFALLHLVWERKEIIPQLPGLWLMGMALVLARLVNGGSLGLAWGLHSGWVWAIAFLDTTQMLTYTGKAPEWVTGVNGKPLAGGLGIFLLLATGGVLWLFIAN